MNRESKDKSHGADDGEATVKPGGLGADGTIPSDPHGVAAGHTGEPSTFEPEEDEQVKQDAPTGAGGHEGPGVETAVRDAGFRGDTADDLNDSADSYASPARTGNDED